MSILTCVTSSEEVAASLSSSNNMNNGAFCYPPHHQNPLQQIKKKRNQPGNPDPEAEVIALSPKTLVATNRFFCEICNKGFQRDQNLQLHRRGHNLPWKLKKRENKDVVKKKVYICPESSCVHNDPSRALGDLTGIKKHFSRKHGEKKWKCEKCSKRYAVQSDCKAHSKTCGTREYKCECGTIFSRRDSFITHRAFCDTLAVESGRSSAITGNPTIFSSQMNLQFQQPHYFNSHHDQLPAATFSMKKKQQPSSSDFRHIIEIPPWLIMNNSQQPFLGANLCPPPPPPNQFSPSSTRLDQEYTQSHKDLSLHENPNSYLGGGLASAAASPHISATALLQKSISNKESAAVSAAAYTVVPAYQTHVSVTDDTHSATKQTDQTYLSSREDLMMTTGTTIIGPANISAGMMSTTCFSNFANNNAATGFDGSTTTTTTTTFEDAILFGGFSNLNSKKDDDDDVVDDQMYFNDGSSTITTLINEEDHMTKDFLGLRPLSHTDDIFNIAAFVSSTTE